MLLKLLMNGDSVNLWVNYWIIALFSDLFGPLFFNVSEGKIDSIVKMQKRNCFRLSFETVQKILTNL